MWRWMIGVIGGLFIVYSVYCYNERLNQEIRVVSEDIYIKELSEAFEGFKILQVTDLHGFWFGEEQEQLIELIESLDYDLIAFTGDLGDLHDDSTGIAMQSLIKGLSKDKYMVYVEGNHGPFLTDDNGQKTEIAYWLESQGVHLLVEPLLIEKSNQRLCIAYQSDPFYQMNGLEEVREEDVLIGIMHYPMNEAFYQSRGKSDEFPPYDLILAGHYHGGQWRIPGLGAFFISDINGDSWLPSQERVSGLTEWSGYLQYVSRGLGASGKNRVLKKRWFNPPEVNLLELKTNNLLN